MVNSVEIVSNKNWESMNTKIAEFAMAKHTIVAKDEMIALENQF